MKITQQCTFKFSIIDKYIEEVTCEVVPLDVCQVILGSPYFWDCYAIYHRREQKFKLIKDRMEFYIKAKTSSVITQAKRLINASTKLVLTAI